MEYSYNAHELSTTILEKKNHEYSYTPKSQDPNAYLEHEQQ